MDELFVEERLTSYLLILKISPNLKGYTYIKEAVKRVYENKKNITKLFFNKLAGELDEKPYVFNRALRHAVEVSRKRRGLKNFERERNLSFSEGAPTPKEFVYVLAECLKLDCGTGNNIR